MYLDTNHYKHFLVIDKCASKLINKKQVQEMALLQRWIFNFETKMVDNTKRTKKELSAKK